MTTKETALALGVSESTIQRHAKELGLTENGKQTELDERAVTIIKTKIERSGRSDLRNVAELYCVDNAHSRYKYVPGFKIAGALEGKE